MIPFKSSKMQAFPDFQLRLVRPKLPRPACCPLGISIFFALDGKLPGVGTLEKSNPPKGGGGSFVSSHSQIVLFKLFNVRFSVSINVFLCNSTRILKTARHDDTSLWFVSEDDYRTGCQNVSHCQQQQSYSGLRSPGRSNSTHF